MTPIKAGDWEMTLRPGLGGAIASLTLGGLDILRPTRAGETDPLQAACFPLLPYANRIDHGRFAFQGRTVQMAPTPRFEPHGLHGAGWLAPWDLAFDGDVAVMTYEYAAGDWPWSFRGEQRFDLTPEGLTVTLSLTNTDTTAMPAGLGLHPYFVRRPGIGLSFNSTGVWLADETQLPVKHAAPDALFDWRDGPQVDDAPFVDNAYSGWDGVATVSDPLATIRLSASANATGVHVFAPRGEDFFCVEPVTHRPNAINAPAAEATGVLALAPGDTAVVSMTLSRA